METSYYKINRIQRTLFISFAFLLPVNQKISTWLIGLLLVLSLIKVKRKTNWFAIEYLAPIVLYMLYCVSLLYSTELQLGIIEQKASLLVFPLIFILSNTAKEQINLILKYFVYGCIVAVLLCEVAAIINSFDVTNYILDSRIDKEQSFFNSIVNDTNYFFSYSFSVIHQTVYFSMYLLFALTILIFKNPIKNSNLKILFIIAILIGLLQILNKASFIILFAILCLKLWQLIGNKKMATIIILLTIFAGTLLFSFNPRFKKFNSNFRIDETELKIKDYKAIPNLEANKTNTRIMLWVSSIELIQENYLFGIGAGGSHHRLYERFAIKRQWYWEKEKYHAHNQYLQILLDIGLIGFLTFVFMFVFLVRSIQSTAIVEDKDLLVSFIVIVAINFVFESMFERYSGISFFAFFYCLLVSNRKMRKVI